MRVLIIRNHPSCMDVSNITYNIQEVGLAKALIRRGHTCNIVFWGKVNQDVDITFDSGLHLCVYYRTGKNILKNVIYDQLEDLIGQHDIVQVSEYNQIQSWLLAQKYPEKTIVYHGPYYSPFNKRYNLMCAAADVFFLGKYKTLHTPFITKSHLAQSFLAQKGLKNVHTIGVGIDIGALTTSESEIPEFIQNIRHTSDTINLLYIGCMEPRRNIPFLFRVAKQLRDSGKKIQLILVGTGDQDYLDLCEKMINDLGLQKHIVRSGVLQQKYLSHLYKKCDFFLLPTEYEIFGMVLLEAMYYGLTVLTTANGGSDMLISDGQNGFILPLSVDQWCAAIEENIHVKRLGELAHLKIKKEFTWDMLSNQFESAYQALLDSVMQQDNNTV